MASSSRHLKSPRSSAPASPAARDWALLPPDILFSVFLMLGPYEILRGADRACTAWRRVAVDDPLLCRRIDMDAVLPCSFGGRAVMRVAMDRAAGHCEAFSGPCDNYLLFFLVKRAPSLKILHLKHLYAPNKVLTLVLKRLPLLEDLEISPSYVSSASENLFQFVCKDCPRLKKLRLNCTESFDFRNDSGLVIEKISGGITLMRELRSVELFHCDLTTEGLRSILDNCPLLETLCITGFLVGGKMDEKLRQKCGTLKNLTLPDKSVKLYRLIRGRSHIERRVSGPWDWEIDG